MIKSDEPISQPEQDHLFRTTPARVLADDLRNLDPATGVVVGILGPWGSGKTSFINLIRHELDNSPQYPVLDFNPWLFSDTDELVQRFFSELAEQLRLKSDKFNTMADKLEHYGDVLAPLQVLPVVGAWVGRASGSIQAVKKLRGKGQGGVASLRKDIDNGLRELQSPIVVVVDDVDRLQSNEIRDVFKLVRLTANFPNMIYLVAFDRTRVETALAEDGLPGREYLEKIVQITFDLPAVPDSAIRAQVAQAIFETLNSLEDAGRLDTNLWPDVFEEIIRPLIRHMRDVRRYAASLRSTVNSLDGRIELVDVLALEAIRVFLPDAFLIMFQSQAALTTPSDNSDFSRRQDEKFARIVNQLLDATDTDRPVIDATIRRIFPHALRHVPNSYGFGESLSNLIRNRRIAHPDLLSFYFERVAGRSLRSFWNAEHVLTLMNNSEDMVKRLQEIDPSEWSEIIHSLESFEGEYPLDAVVPGSVVLLNLINQMPKKEREIFNFFDEEMVVTRVVLRLLRRLESTAAVAAALEEALPSVITISDKFRLVSIVGHQEHVGHKLVDEEASERLERQIRELVRQALPEDLALERDLNRLLTFTKSNSGPDEGHVTLPTSGSLACAILKGSLSEVRSQGMGTRAVTTEKVLNWDGLLNLVNEEATVREIVDWCKSTAELDPELSLALELAEKYLSGWRPERW